MSVSDTKYTTIIILDDHPILRKGVSGIIESIDSDIEIVSSGSLKECIDLIEIYNPSLIIADLNLPDSGGIDALKVLVQVTKTPILVYSLKKEELVGPACYKHGAKAYVMKDACSDDLEAAIIAVLDGKVWCSSVLAAKLMNPDQDSGTSGIEKLSVREVEIFENIGKGNSVKEIAFNLNLSPKTVESHRDRIKVKLGLNNSTELILIAKDWLTG